MKKLASVGLSATLLALLMIVVTATIASAHEVRHVGNYTFVVGFLDEPAYANVKNSIDLTICSGQQCTYTVKDGTRVVSNPINDADKTLKAEVISGASAPLALPLEARYGNPGKYSSYFVPSTAGTYTFHITGTLEGNQIDEKFTSSPTTFGDVGTIKTYPAATTTQTQDAANVATLQTQVKQAQDAANTARTFGIIGLIAGVLGLGLAAFAFARKSQLAPAATSTAKETADSLRG